KPYPRNARTHSKKQIRQIASSIRRFGFTNPVLIDDDLSIIAGHGRVEAAKQLEMTEVPCLRLSHLSAAQKRAYILADNRIAEKAGGDREILAIELQSLIELEFEMDVIGFEPAEIDLILDEAGEAAPEGETGPEDAAPSMPDPTTAVTRAGDLWRLGRHVLLCGDARDSAAYAALMGNEQADLIFTDPPYNVPIDGHVCGLGRIRHRSFAMGV